MISFIFESQTVRLEVTKQRFKVIFSNYSSFLNSDYRSDSFCFYMQLKILLVFVLAISDVISEGRPPFLRVPPPT